MCQQFATYHVVSEFSNFGDDRPAELPPVIPYSSLLYVVRATGIVALGSNTIRSRSPSLETPSLVMAIPLASFSFPDRPASHTGHLDQVLPPTSWHPRGYVWTIKVLVIHRKRLLVESTLQIEDQLARQQQWPLSSRSYCKLL
jgi:hypothetical protein